MSNFKILHNCLCYKELSFMIYLDVSELQQKNNLLCIFYLSAH